MKINMGENPKKNSQENENQQSTKAEISPTLQKAGEKFQNNVQKAAATYVIDIAKACIKLQESDGDYDEAIAEYESSIAKATTDFIKSTTDASAEYAETVNSETKAAFEQLSDAIDIFSSIMF